MKSTILIFCLSLLASQLTEATADTAVFDTSGHEVLPGVDYYIRSHPATSPTGNLTLCWRNMNTRLTVALDGSGKRTPVQFHPVDPEAKVVTVNTDLHVAFSHVMIPGPSPTAWKLRPEAETENIYVGIQGTDPLADLFQIKRGWYQSYMFAYGADVDAGHDITSGDLGILPVNGENWLGLPEHPLPFVFEKA